MKNAHDLGAEVVIISDYKDEAQRVEEEAKYVVDHDGQLRSHIPAFEIDWHDAQKLVKVVTKGE